MESENRSYRRSGSELFICFTSRNSSNIKVCSKSAQSPGRNSGKFSNNNSASSSSLSCSLSRRLRSNGSIKGSPMFPSGSGKKKGEPTAEPSSPKVTCIGQVRVKTKKQGQKFRKKKSKRRDVSFRKSDQDGGSGNFHSSSQQQQQQQQQECLPHRNQRWVHLPLSICEALRAFGAEFSCLLPCKPSCLTNKKRRQNNASTQRNTSSCRQTFEKWVMTSLHESGHNHNNENELVVSRREDGMMRREEMIGEIEMEISEEKRVSFCKEISEDEDEEEEEEEGRVSICVPPRNALLLMRCRSEPLRMSALANHFWESPVKDKKEEKEDLQQTKQQAVVLVAQDDGDDSDSDEEEGEDGDGDEEEDSEVEDETEVKLELKNPKEEENADISLEEHDEEEKQGCAEEMVVKKVEEDVNENVLSCIEPLKEEEEVQEIVKLEKNEEEPTLQLQMQEEEKELKEERIESRRPSTSSRRASFSSCTRSIHEDEAEEEEEECEEKEQIPEPEPVKVVGFEERVNNATEEKATKPRISVEKRSTLKSNNRNDTEEEALPDCLLLMMCEPKLSMEVSKETWVCSTDFIRFRPERKVVQNNGGGGDNVPTKKRNSTDSKGRHSLDSKSRLSTDSKSRLSTDSKSRLSTDSNPGSGRPPLHSKHQKPPTPPRRSLSKPAPPPSVAKSAAPAPPPPPAKLVPPVEVSTSPAAMATMIEQKLVNVVAYEPLVLTRCKSEPMRASAKLAPEACFWKNMKLELHTQGPPNLGAATGIGC